MSLPLKWEFPGGKRQENETAEEALRREFQEELNISIIIDVALTPTEHDYGHFRIALIPFLARLGEGDIQLREHAQIGWFTAAELRDLDWAPADVPVVDEILSRRLIL